MNATRKKKKRRQVSRNLGEGYPSSGTLFPRRGKQIPNTQFSCRTFRSHPRNRPSYLEIIRTIDAVDFDPDHKGYFFPTGSRVNKLAISRDDLATILATSEAVSHLGKTFQNNFQKLTEKIFAGSSKASPDEKQPIIIRAPQTIQGDTLEKGLRILPGMWK